MKEPYLTLVGPAIWRNPKLQDMILPDPDQPGFGLAGIFPVETFSADAIVESFKWYNSPRGHAGSVRRQVRHATTDDHTFLPESD